MVANRLVAGVVADLVFDEERLNQRGHRLRRPAPHPWRFRERDAAEVADQFFGAFAEFDGAVRHGI